MVYLISQIIGCLLIALGIGCVIGYLLKQFLGGQAMERLESMWSEKVRKATRELDALRSDLKAQTQRTEDLEKAEESLRLRLTAAESSLAAEKQKSADAGVALAAKGAAMASAATDWKAKLEAAAANAAALEGAVQAKDSSIQNLEAGLAAATQASGAKDLNIQTLGAQVAELTPLTGKLDVASKALTDWEVRFKSLESSKNGELATLKSRLAELEPLAAKVKDWEARYNGMLKEKDSSLAKLTANVAALEPLKAKVDSATKDQAALSTKIKELELAGVGLTALAAKVPHLEASLKTSEVAVAEGAKLAATLRARIAEIEPLESKLHVAGEEVGNLRAQVDTAAKERETLLLRIRGLESGEKSHLEKIHALEASHKHFEAAAAEHATLVSNLRARVADVEPLEHKLHVSGEEVGKLRVNIETAAKEHETLLLRIRGLENGEKDHLAKLHALEASLASASAAEAELHSTKALLAEEKVHHERLRLRVHELEPFHVKFQEAEKKLHGAADGEGKLKLRLTELEGALAEEKQHHERLRLRVHELEPFHVKFQETEKKLHGAADGEGKLKLRLTELETALAKDQQRIHELDQFQSKAGDLDQKLRGETDASAKLRLHLADVEKRSASELAAVRARVDELEPWHAKFNEASSQARDWETRFSRHSKESSTTITAQNDEIVKLKARIAELDALQKKLRAQEEQIQSWDRRFSSTVTEKDGEISRLRIEIGHLAPLRDEVLMWNSRFTTVVAEKDAEIERLRGQMHVVPVSGAAAAAPARAHKPDDLKKIFGIGPVLEKRLNGYGVHWFKQIASWTKHDIIEFEKNLPEFQNRVDRDQWVAGAKEEHLKKYGESL